MIEVSPVSKTEVTKDEAIMACLFCTHNGKKGWRIPTVNEYINNSELAYNIWDQDDLETKGVVEKRFYQFIRTIDDNDTDNNR